jgi:hypothetical protein
VVVVIAGCDVEELLAAAVAGGAVPDVVDGGGRLTLPGAPTDEGVAVLVGADREDDVLDGRSLEESLAGA